MYEVGNLHYNLAAEHIFLKRSKASGEFFLKVGSFGMPMLKNKVKRVIGVKNHVPTQLIIGEENYGGCTELFSLAVILYQMATFEMPYNNVTAKEDRAEAAKQAAVELSSGAWLTPLKRFSKDFQDLLKDILTPDVHQLDNYLDKHISSEYVSPYMEDWLSSETFKSERPYQMLYTPVKTLYLD